MTITVRLMMMLIKMFFVACIAHPDSFTTGAWSKPFSFKILMVFWHVTVGSTVSGAERFRLCNFRFHHLEEIE